jgi:hypothetical protein
LPKRKARFSERGKCDEKEKKIIERKLYPSACPRIHPEKTDAEKHNKKAERKIETNSEWHAHGRRLAMALVLRFAET